MLEVGTEVMLDKGHPGTVALCPRRGLCHFCGEGITFIRSEGEWTGHYQGQFFTLLEPVLADSEWIADVED